MAISHYHLLKSVKHENPPNALIPPTDSRRKGQGDLGIWCSASQSHFSTRKILHKVHYPGCANFAINCHQVWIMQRNCFHNKNPHKKQTFFLYKKKIFNQETPVASSRWSRYKKPSPTHAWFKYSFQRKSFDEIRELNIKTNVYQLQKTVRGVTAGQLRSKELTALLLCSLSKCFRTWDNFIKTVMSKSY